MPLHHLGDRLYLVYMERSIIPYIKTFGVESHNCTQYINEPAIAIVVSLVRVHSHHTGGIVEERWIPSASADPLVARGESHLCFVETGNTYLFIVFVSIEWFRFTQGTSNTRYIS